MTTALRLSLADIAALARVRRPVVSMWRTRFAEGPMRFPAPLDGGNSPQFDAEEVARWLADTAHGNNPDAVADAAAFGTVADPSTHRPVIEALITLHVADDEPLAGSDLTERAWAVDPFDAFLADEVLSLPTDSPLPAYVDAMIDAAYSPLGAWQRLVEHATAPSATGSGGPLSPLGLDALATVATALTTPGTPVLADAGAALSAGDLFSAAAAAIGDDAALHVPEGEAGRGIRRLLFVRGHAHAVSSDAAAPGAPAVVLARLAGTDPARELASLEDLVVELSDHQRALVIGPDTLLTEPLSGSAGASREHVLRSGRVRGIVRLPEGLVPTAPRLALAAWLIGGPQGGTPLAERFTVVGDLRGLTLSRARAQDLTADLLASLGTAREAMAHAFRFVRFVRTSALIASEGSLVAAGPVARSAPGSRPARELPALIDERLARLDPRVALDLAPSHHTRPAPVLLGDAVAAGEARILSGARVHPDDTHNPDGFPVLGRAEVRAGAASDRRIDRVRVAVEYPRAELTQPGDVVFLAGARPAAIVDAEGSSVVEFPARILRLVDAALVPEVVAADISALPDPLPWRRWPLRRVPAGQATALRESLDTLRTARAEAERRAAELTELEALVMSAVTAGVLADARPASSDPERTA